MGRPAILGPLC